MYVQHYRSPAPRASEGGSRAPLFAVTRHSVAFATPVEERQTVNTWSEQQEAVGSGTTTPLMSSTPSAGSLRMTGAAIMVV